MADSMQDRKGRVRPPRVHITMDVHTGGQQPKKEIPFALGYFGDLSGDRQEPLGPVEDRRFTELDPDTFQRVFEKAAPHLTFQVENLIDPDPDGKPKLLTADLDFETPDDFEPRRVASKVDGVKDLLKLRDALEELAVILQTNPDLERALQRVMADPDERQKWRSFLNVTS